MQGFRKNEIELERDVQEQLADWKKKRHMTVLQVEGPRQVGKTYEIRKFVYSNYRQVIYVNLVRDEFGFEDSISADGFMEQYCKKAGIAYLRMLPLSFQEFCRALGLEDTLMKLDLHSASPKEDYACLEDAYQAFRRIGGYPQVVTTYIKAKSINDCMEVLGDLIRTFTAESSRFFINSTALSIFHEAYKAVLVQVTEEKKATGKTFLEFVTNFVKESVKEPVSRNEVRSAVSWLLYSGIIGYCDLYNNGDVTDVVGNRRAYFADSGIANYISNMVTVPKDAIEGMLAETFAYTELNRLYQLPIGKKKVRGDKPCFSTCGDYELDFVAVDQEDRRFGIEVKTDNSRALSLEFFRDRGMIGYGIKAALSSGGKGSRFDTIPIYTIGCRFPYGI